MEVMGNPVTNMEVEVAEADNQDKDKVIEVTAENIQVTIAEIGATRATMVV